MKALHHIFLFAAAAGALMGLTACDGMIYDDPGPCPKQLAFTFKRNLSFADAFPRQVERVRVGMFDQQGAMVWQKEAEVVCNDPDTNNFSLSLPDDLPTGDYIFQVWAGDLKMDHCDIAAAQRLEEHACKLRRDADGHLTPSAQATLFHGLARNVHFDYNEAKTATVDLSKNTNYLSVVLQSLSGRDLREDDFTFTVTDDNGLMAYDNSLLPDQTLTYHPYDVKTAMAGIANPDAPQAAPARGRGNVEALVASFNLGRLMAQGHATTLTVSRRSDGKKVLSVPVSQYALLVRGHYPGITDEQDYLDRQDNYSMTFFLDERDEWMNAFIFINSWRVVLQDADL